MHALQPMQTDFSKSTMPSGRVYIAPVGQAVTHGASAHWLQRVTWNERPTCGNSPTSTALTYVRVTPSGTRFSDLHAVVHAWQPMHRHWSSTFTKRGARSSPFRRSRMSKCSSLGVKTCLPSVRAPVGPRRRPVRGY